MTSYKPEFQTDNTGKWYDNALRFATETEALNNARDLSFRWFAVKEYRASACADAVSYSYHDGKLQAVIGKGNDNASANV